MFNSERFQPVSSPAARSVAFLGIGLALLVVFVTPAVGFGAGTACTNHFNCTETVCNAACDRVSLGGYFALLGQIGVVVLLCVGLARDRLHSVLIPLVAVALTMEIGWAAYRIAASWTLAR